MIPVVDALDAYMKVNNNDPRNFLDNNYWNSLLNRHGSQSYDDIDEWYTSTFGPNNWTRFYHKIWFTNQEQYIMFQLAWTDSIYYPRETNELLQTN